MRLTILGASPACQNPGGHCSGYLIQDGDTSLVVDCGSGVFSLLQTYIDPAQVTAVLITHMHADHTLDLIPYRYFLFFEGMRGEPTPHPPLLLPPGGEEVALKLSSIQDGSASFFRDVFAVAEYDPATSMMIGSLTVSFVRMRHIEHTYGLRVISSDGRVLAFSSDTGPCSAAVTVAERAHLFLCEAANAAHNAYPLHLTAEQAGQIAAEADVDRLVLTHRWERLGIDTAVQEARASFGGDILSAREGLTLDV